MVLAFKGIGEIGEDYQTTGYTGYEYAYVLQMDGSNLTNLGRTWTRPEWSTDGNSLAFIGLEDDKRSILAVAPDGSGRGSLIDVLEGPPSYKSFEYLSWSLDGTKLVHSIFDDISFRYNAYVINLKQHDGFGENPVTTRIGRGVGSWSPDNSRIAILKHSPYTFYTVRPDGSHYEVLVTKGEDGLLSGSEWRAVEDGSRQNK